MASGFDPQFARIDEMRAALDRGRIRPIALTERVIARIDRLDRRLGAFTVVTRQRALKEAAEAEAALVAGDEGRPLLGIPYAVKDLFDVAGEATTAGTRLQKDNLAREDCGLVRKLAKAGMILVGKTHTTQLASNVIGYNPDFGTPHNPWQADPWIPGGSSGGAAVAVAAGLVPVSLGTDTGGSVRIPAALCGIVGLKTTYGRVSRAGVYPLCPSLDTVGPLTRSVRDAAEILAAIQGGAPDDSGTLGRRYRDPTIDLASAVTGLRVAFDEAFFLKDAEPEVEKAFDQALRDLETLAVEVVPVSLSTLREAAKLDWWHYFAAEAYASNRHLFEGGVDALDPGVHWMREGAALCPQEVSRALRQRDRLAAALAAELADYDGLIAPTSTRTALPLEGIGGRSHIFEDVYAHNAVIGNILSLCGVSVPCGFSSAGMPIGLTVYAKPFEEEVGLRLAYAFETATSWHLQRPDLSWAD